jgi:IS30 family transposase
MKKNNPESAKKYSHLSLEEREEIAIWLEKGMKQCESASMLKRSPSTISREIKRNNPSARVVRYRVDRAQLKPDERKAESHARKRIPGKRLRNFICKHIRTGYSPEIVAAMAAKKNKRWKTNYETIYQWIYSDRHDLIPFLARSHKKRRRRGSAKQKRCVKIPNRKMIEQRPGHVNLCSRIGHWEADTAISRQRKAAIMVLVERRTRYVILKNLTQRRLLPCIMPR